MEEDDDDLLSFIWTWLLLPLSVVIWTGRHQVDLTSARSCNYSCTSSLWWLSTPETCRAAYRNVINWIQSHLVGQLLHSIHDARTHVYKKSCMRCHKTLFSLSDRQKSPLIVLWVPCHHTDRKFLNVYDYTMCVKMGDSIFAWFRFKRCWCIESCYLRMLPCVVVKEVFEFNGIYRQTQRW